MAVYKRTLALTIGDNGKYEKEQKEVFKLFRKIVDIDYVYYFM